MANIVSAIWDFGDGTTGNGLTVVHTYQTAGTFYVTLTVTDDEGRTSTKAYKVGAWDNRVFYDWEFGDGEEETTIDVATVTHQYTRAGSVTARLTMYDLWQRVSSTLELALMMYGVNANPDPTEGHAPLLVKFQKEDFLVP
jgi:PKD repeat protein